MTFSMSTAVLSAAFALGAAAANASTITVDFTDDSSYDSFSSAGATGAIGTTQSWTATPEPSDTLTRSSYDGAGNFAPTPLSFSDYDGLGVVDDEIAFPSQFVTLKFSTKLQVTGLHFLDVFGDEGVEIFLDGSATSFASYGSGFSPFTFGASASGDNSTGGYAFIDLSKIDVAITTITFGAITDNDANGAPDIALAGIDFFANDSAEPEPVPLPAGGVLLLTAMGGLAAVRRRKARKAA